MVNINTLLNNIKVKLNKNNCKIIYKNNFFEINNINNYININNKNFKENILYYLLASIKQYNDLNYITLADTYGYDIEKQKEAEEIYILYELYKYINNKMYKLFNKNELKLLYTYFQYC